SCEIDEGEAWGTGGRTNNPRLRPGLVRSRALFVRAAWALRRSIRRKPARGYKGAIRPQAESTPVDIRALGVGAASLLSAAAQDSTMGAPADLRAVDGLALKDLIELENLGSAGFGTRLENCPLPPFSLPPKSSPPIRIRSARRSWRPGGARPSTCTSCASARPRTCSLASTPSTPTSS